VTPGPLAGSQYGAKPGPKTSSRRQPGRRRAPSRDLVPTGLLTTQVVSTTPAPPPGLSSVATETWHLIWSAFPEGVLSVELDAETVGRYCRLLDQRAQLVAAVDADGITLTKAQQSATGKVIGEEIYLHPALAAIAKTDREIDTIGASLGTSPASRAKLGLVIAYASQASAGARSILQGLTK
jgi:P27 family predicted phage terminase small subunit